MAKNAKVQESLVEQIFNGMFVAIENREEFDPQTIQKLKQLAQDGELTKTTQVAKAIDARLEETP